MTLVALSAENICSCFKQHFYLYFLTVGNMGLKSKRMETDFKVNYLISSTCESTWILLKAETWWLGLWWWCHGPKTHWGTLSSMKSCKRALTQGVKVQYQICQSSGGAGHGEIPNIFEPGKIAAWPLIGWSESSAKGLVWAFRKLFSSRFPTTTSKEGFKILQCLLLCF